MALQEEAERQGNWLFKHRSYLPLLILAVGLAVYWSGAPAEHNVYYELICLAVSLVGLAVRIYTVGYTPDNTSGRNTLQGQVADDLNTTGIYSLVRHPLYLGNFFMWLGVCLLTSNFWFIIAFCFLYWIYYERIMFAEEQFLRRKFETKYLEWAARTSAFIPVRRKSLHRASGLNGPTLLFSWKKVLKKEKDGFIALFAIFALFDITRVCFCRFVGAAKSTTATLCASSVSGWKAYESYFSWELAACIVALVIYCILKFLKNKTTVLDEDGR